MQIDRKSYYILDHDNDVIMVIDGTSTILLDDNFTYSIASDSETDIKQLSRTITDNISLTLDYTDNLVQDIRRGFKIIFYINNNYHSYVIDIISKKYNENGTYTLELDAQNEIIYKLNNTDILGKTITTGTNEDMLTLCLEQTGINLGNVSSTNRPYDSSTELSISTGTRMAFLAQLIDLYQLELDLYIIPNNNFKEYDLYIDVLVTDDNDGTDEDRDYHFLSTDDGTLASISRTVQTDFKTRFYVYGSKANDTDALVSIASVNNGLDYIDYENHNEKYNNGLDYLTTVLTFDIKNPQQLLDHAKKHISSNKLHTPSIVYDAVPSLIDGDIDTYLIGDNVKLYDKELDITDMSRILGINGSLKDDSYDLVIGDYKLGDFNFTTKVAEKVKDIEKKVKELDEDKDKGEDFLDLKDIKTYDGMKFSVRQPENKTAPHTYADTKASKFTSVTLNPNGDGFTVKLAEPFDTVDMKDLVDYVGKSYEYPTTGMFAESLFEFDLTQDLTNFYLMSKSPGKPTPDGDKTYLVQKYGSYFLTEPKVKIYASDYNQNGVHVDLDITIDAECLNFKYNPELRLDWFSTQGYSGGSISKWVKELYINGKNVPNTGNNFAGNSVIRLEDYKNESKLASYNFKFKLFFNNIKNRSSFFNPSYFSIPLSHEHTETNTIIADIGFSFSILNNTACYNEARSPIDGGFFPSDLTESQWIRFGKYTYSTDGKTITKWEGNVPTNNSFKVTVNNLNLKDSNSNFNFVNKFSENKKADISAKVEKYVYNNTVGVDESGYTYPKYEYDPQEDDFTVINYNVNRQLWSVIKNSKDSDMYTKLKMDKNFANDIEKKATKDEVKKLETDKADKSEVVTLEAKKANKADLDATNTEVTSVTARVKALEDNGGSGGGGTPPDLTNYYTKNETNTLLSSKANKSDVSNYAVRLRDVENELADNYYTKSSTDNLLNTKANTTLTAKISDRVTNLETRVTNLEESGGGSGGGSGEVTRTEFNELKNEVNDLADVIYGGGANTFSDYIEVVHRTNADNVNLDVANYFNDGEISYVHNNAGTGTSQLYTDARPRIRLASNDWVNKLPTGAIIEFTFLITNIIGTNINYNFYFRTGSIENSVSACNFNFESVNVKDTDTGRGTSLSVTSSNLDATRELSAVNAKNRNTLFTVRMKRTAVKSNSNPIILCFEYRPITSNYKLDNFTMTIKDIKAKIISGADNINVRKDSFTYSDSANYYKEGNYVDIVSDMLSTLKYEDRLLGLLSRLEALENK